MLEFWVLGCERRGERARGRVRVGGKFQHRGK